MNHKHTAGLLFINTNKWAHNTDQKFYTSHKKIPCDKYHDTYCRNSQGCNSK